MEVQQIKSGSLNNTQESTQVGRGHLNGLLFHFTDDGTAEGGDITETLKKTVSLNVTLHSGDRQILVPEVLITRLDAIESFRSNTKRTVKFSYVHLGSIYLEDGDELRVSIKGGDGTNKVYYTMATLSFERSPYMPIKYESLVDKNTSIPDALLVFGFGDGDVNIEIENAAYSNYNASAGLFKGAAWAMPNSNLDAELVDFDLLYQDMDGLEKSIWVRVTGGNSISPYQIINLRRIENLNSIAKSTIKAAEKVGQRVRNLEMSQPDKAKALRYAGKIAKSSVYLNMAASGNNNIKSY